MREIEKYLEKFASLCKKLIDERRLLLGRSPQKIVHFTTKMFMELNFKKISQQIEKDLGILSWESNHQWKLSG